jgi:putative methyltransferase (TIGR04325 family)
MAWKARIKAMVPGAVADVYRATRDVLARRPSWEGIYQRLSDVPSQGGAYQDAGLVAAIREMTRRELERPQVTGENLLLPMLVEMIAREKTPVTVLDFGGGMGIARAQVMGAASHGPSVRFTVVENETIAREGRALHPAGAIDFVTGVPAAMPDLDILHVNSALQYVDDYRGLLLRLCALRPAWVLLVRLSAGDLPTFATAQTNLPGSSVPYWFIDIREILDLLGSQGYELVLRGLSDRTYDQSSFPATHRLGRTANLLFRRAEPQGR